MRLGSGIHLDIVPLGADPLLYDFEDDRAPAYLRATLEPFFSETNGVNGFIGGGCVGSVPLLIARRAPQILAWHELDELLAVQQLAWPRMNTVTGGRWLEPGEYLNVERYPSGRTQTRTDFVNLRRILFDGATLAVNAIEEMWPQAQRTAAAAAATFGERTAMNCYASFSEDSGLGPHRDDHDNFALQQEGRKCWRLGSPATSESEFRQFLASTNPQRFPLLDEPGATAEIELEPGDVLYIPEGWWHDVRTVDRRVPSLHLTMSLPRSDIGDYLRWLADVLPDGSESDKLPQSSESSVLDSPPALVRSFRCWADATYPLLPSSSLPYKQDIGAETRFEPTLVRFRWLQGRQSLVAGGRMHTARTAAGSRALATLVECDSWLSLSDFGTAEREQLEVANELVSVGLIRTVQVSRMPPK